MAYGDIRYPLLLNQALDPVRNFITQTLIPARCAIIRTLTSRSNIPSFTSPHVLRFYPARNPTLLNARMRSSASHLGIAKMIPSVSPIWQEPMGPLKITKPPTPSLRSSVDYVSTSSTSPCTVHLVLQFYPLHGSSASSALFDGNHRHRPFCPAQVIVSGDLSTRSKVISFVLFDPEWQLNVEPSALKEFEKDVRRIYNGPGSYPVQTSLPATHSGLFSHLKRCVNGGPSETFPKT